MSDNTLVYKYSNTPLGVIYFYKFVRNLNSVCPIMVDSTSTRHLLPVNKTSSVRNGLQIIESLAKGSPKDFLFKYYRLLPRLLVTLQNLMVTPYAEDNTYLCN